jgi:disulfide bond formation protein DsbB
MGIAIAAITLGVWFTYSALKGVSLADAKVRHWTRPAVFRVEALRTGPQTPQVLQTQAHHR